MKKVLQFSGIIALVLAVVAFILMMATNAVNFSNSLVDAHYAGTTAIFGADTTTALGTVHTNLAWCALLAWIFVLVALIILLAGIVLPLLKVTALQKFAGILNLVAVILLVVAGVFMFLVVPVFLDANSVSSSDGFSIGAGWVIGGILAISGGVMAILPAVFDFIGKKK